MTNQIRNVNLKIEVVQGGNMGKDSKECLKQVLVKIVRDLPKIDPRIKGIEQTSEGIIVETIAGKVSLSIPDT